MFFRNNKLRTNDSNVRKTSKQLHGMKKVQEGWHDYQSQRFD